MKFLLPLSLVVLLSGKALALGETIVIHGGKHGSVGGVVTFKAPLSLKGDHLLQAASGESTPLQVNENGDAIFIEPKMGKGETRTYTIASLPPSTVALGFGADKKDTTLQFISKADKKPVFTYQMEPGDVPAGTGEQFKHGAHLHPVYSPSGRLITGNHPPDHPHQRGIWFAWAHTEFARSKPDFWNMGKGKDGKLTGEIRFETLDKKWSGSVQGGFESTHRWVDQSTGTEEDVLWETWAVSVCKSVCGTKPAYLIDFTSTLSCSSSEPLKLPKYHYGGLGVRGNALWDAVDKVTMLTSNGDDRKAGNATKARWLWMGGDVEGQATGIAVLIHPENFRFPQPLRLNPENPQISVAPSVDGDWSIGPGASYVSRYRFVVADGKPDAAELERLWADYAEPLKVELK